MQSRAIYLVGRFVPAFFLSAVALMGAITIASAQLQPGVVPPPNIPVRSAVPQPAQNPGDALVWDAIMKEQAPQPGQITADFIFNARNTADHEVAIGRLQPSCGCTTAKLPTTPWVLAPGTNGDISVSVNLAGKFGAVTKTVTVFSTNNQIMKVLTVKVNLPENPDMMRMRNRSMATADPQAIFKGDCAKCHVEPARGKMGKQLYVTACAICHESKQRDHMVPDLHNLNHPTFYGYWRLIIAEGKPHSMMPAFSSEHGGFLTEEQMDSLAKVLTQAFPSAPGTVQTNGAPAAVKTSALPPPPAPVKVTAIHN